MLIYNIILGLIVWFLSGYLSIKIWHRWTLRDYPSVTNNSMWKDNRNFVLTSIAFGLISLFVTATFVNYKDKVTL